MLAILKANIDCIIALMESRKIFPAILDQLIRDLILQNISLVNYLIPLLKTFFENLKYLKPYCIILKHLISNKIKGIIYRSLKAYYYYSKNLTVLFLKISQWRYSKRRFIEDQQLYYIQLWAFCLRNFLYITQFAPQKEIKKEKPTIKELSLALY